MMHKTKIQPNNQSKSKSVLPSEPKFKTINPYVQSGIIVMFAVLLYCNTIPNLYAMDDYMVIQFNAFTQKGFAGLHDIFAYDSFKGFGDNYVNSVAGGRYRPLSIASFAIEKQLWGENPHVSHFINTLFYAFTCLLLFKILTKLLSHLPKTHWYASIPFLATLLFTAHPIHTEVCANIKCRDEIFALFFSLLSFWFYLSYIDNTSKWYKIILSAFMFFLALLSKEIALVFLVFIPASLYFFSNVSIKKIANTSIPLVVIGLVFLVIRHIVIAKTSQDNTAYQNVLNYSFHDMTLPEKWATITYCLGMYVKLLFVPHPLTWDYYPYHIGKMHWSDASVIISLLVYAAMFYFMVKGLKSKTIVSFCCIVFIVPLLMTANIFFPIGAFMCERFLFISSLGFALLIAWITVNYQHKIKVKPLYLIIPILLLYSVKTISRNRDWFDGTKLIETDYKISKNSYKSITSIGEFKYNKATKLPDGVEKNSMYDEIFELELRADSICHDIPRTNFILGTIYGRYKNDYPKSIYYLKKAMQLDQTYIDSYQNLGVTYAMLKQFDNAKTTFYKGLQVSPNNIDIYKSLSALYYMIGNNDSVAICVAKVKALESKNEKK